MTLTELSLYLVSFHLHGVVSSEARRSGRAALWFDLNTEQTGICEAGLKKEGIYVF